MKADYVDEWNGRLDFCTDEGKPVGCFNSPYARGKVALYIENGTDWPEILTLDIPFPFKKPSNEALLAFNEIINRYVVEPSNLTRAAQPGN